MTNERTAYSDSLDFSEQLSYIKHFHPGYGLFSMNFQRLKHIMNLFKITEKENMTSAECQHDISKSTHPLTGQTDKWVPPVIESGLT